MAVYFVQGVDGGPVKIGYAENPQQRLRDLQCGSPVILRIVATVDGDSARERELHRLFSTKRLHGEWFDPSGPVAEFVTGLRNEPKVEYSDAPLPARYRRRRMPRARYIPLGKAILAHLEHGHWESGRQIADGLRMGRGPDRGVWTCLAVLHQRGWVEKRAPKWQMRSNPTQWRMGPDLRELRRTLAARVGTSPGAEA